MQVYVHRLKPAGVFHTPASSMPLYGFIYVVDGEALVNVGENESDNAFYVKSGDLLLLPEKILFEVRWYHGNIGYSGAFSRSFLKDTSYAFLHSGHPLLHSFRDSFPHKQFADSIFAQMMERFVSYSRLAAKPDAAFLSSAIDLILSDSASSSPNGRNKLVDQFLDKVFDRNETVRSVSEYAARMGVSPNRLNTLVKEATSRNAMVWINLSRLSQAETLLRNTDLPLIDVAARIGIDDQSYFSRFFKKHKGITPLEYRKWSKR